jgi:hypothetical protein
MTISGTQLQAVIAGRNSGRCRLNRQRQKSFEDVSDVKRRGSGIPASYSGR